MNESELHRKRLFVGTCAALVPTAASFAIIGDILGPLKQDFILTNYEVGLIGGAALWGMAISQILLGALADLGMRTIFRCAFVCHFLGVAIMISATGFEGADMAFWILLGGAVIMALGNGLVEVAGNPLVATLYPKEKTTKLNHFHAWFPGGMVIAGLASFGISLTAIGTWEVRMALIFIPIAIYGYLLLTEPFPDTEGRQAGVSMGEMFKATFTRPLFLIMLFCMLITASIELGPMRWIPSVLEAGGIHGILVLVWISGTMMVLRLWAAPVVDRLSPTGILLSSAVISGVGLYLFSFAETTIMAFLLATVFAVGVAFFWPTMLGFVNERMPRTGALGMGLMGGTGMVAAGLIAIPIMGDIADGYVPQRLPQQQTISVLEQTVQTFPDRAQEVAPERQGDVEQAVTLSQNALDIYETEGELPGNVTANAFRAIISSGIDAPVVGQAQTLLGPAENYGGRMAFRFVAPFAGIIALIFGFLFWRDKKSGGYRVEEIRSESELMAQATPST